MDEFQEVCEKKKICAHIFLRNFLHDILKMIYNLRKFQIIIHIFDLPTLSTVGTYF